jgi:D-alanyl-D-alanine carboxypeptidase (penicillin-binding protein 5/6)
VTTVSANDGAVRWRPAAVGSPDAWLKLMNEHAAELGMRNTPFRHAQRLAARGRTYTSARDLAILAEALTMRYPALYHRYFGHRGMRYGAITQSNHDPVTGVVEGADGIKTGFTRQSGYNFLGSPSATAPVGDGRRRSADRLDPQQHARDLLRWGFDAFESRQILPGGLPVGRAAVQNGAAGEVALRTERPVFASVPPDRAGEVRLSIRYRGPVEAPIAEGQEVAYLRVSVPGQLPHDVPLVAAEPVAQANILERLRNGLAGLLT